ncbi:hypothetical protein BEP19_03595 [Ammoniphilus oxalaticus]|uniref:Uncharacterized protein n=1 Tax=Ammoniphilus oxalaticus TaxID=66863 RepID=A0A419SNY5_9BACL|nr:hypothetical protein BEP19_03595 [Ammoniphilus oxalaticus]
MNLSIVMSVISLFIGYSINFFDNGWVVLALTLLSFGMLVRILYRSIEKGSKKPELYVVK